MTPDPDAVIRGAQHTRDAREYPTGEVWTDLLEVAERLRAALEAVRALCSGVKATPSVETFAAAVRAALSAASPTTSDDEPIPMVECNFHGHAHPVGWVGCASSRRAANDEPARCPHGRTEAHWYPTERYGGWCPGPAAPGTPDQPRPRPDLGLREDQ